MFESYEIDCGKVNWNWCHGINVQLDEIEQLFHARIYKLFGALEGGGWQVVGFTSYRKFLVVTFELLPDRIVVEDVNLPADYESIEQAIFDGLGTEPD